MEVEGAIALCYISSGKLFHSQNHQSTFDRKKDLLADLLRKARQDSRLSRCSTVSSNCSVRSEYLVELWCYNFMDSC